METLYKRTSDSVNKEYSRKFCCVFDWGGDGDSARSSSCAWMVIDLLFHSSYITTSILFHIITYLDKKWYLWSCHVKRIQKIIRQVCINSRRWRHIHHHTRHYLRELHKQSRLISRTGSHPVQSHFQDFELRTLSCADTHVKEK